ncbi:MAG: DUF424 family protein [Candidatus Thermoplasmatota archaeon]|nr:DUF424 family protein [Candidatus Thermoplasmatota archaeon]MCL6003176.1 DUF424 family protein [Candidatus Thermoplasmatota archaeon]
MIWTRIFRTSTDTLLAAADEELLGKQLRDGKYRLNISENFYKDVLVENEAFKDLLSLCSVANLVGEKCIGIAIGSGYISKENVIYIQGVPHAQFTTME